MLGQPCSKLVTGGGRTTGQGEKSPEPSGPEVIDSACGHQSRAVAAVQGEWRFLAQGNPPATLPSESL